jgi:peptidoglycan/xylan/chitin deacetylase (PgdA/CDA1 family)
MYAILLYHCIEDRRRSARHMDEIDREYVLTRSRFERQVEYLATKPKSAVPVVLSFDDGDESCYTMAAPILERHGLRADFFIVTQWIGQPGFMTSDQLRDLLSRGHGIHSHTRTHPRLPELTTAQIEDELNRSKAELEAILGRPVTQLSIPGGAYDERVIEIAKRTGYTTVMNSVEGYNDEAAKPFVLQRFTPRAYSDVSMIAGICEHPRATAARIALKRTALTAAKTVLGSRYDRARTFVVSTISRR